MRGTVGAVLLGLGVLSAAGCSGNSGSPGSSGSGSSGSGSGSTAPDAAGPTSTASAAPAAPAPIPPGFTAVTGATYRFGLPAAVSFAVDSERVTDEGGLVKRWRYAVTPSGPFCVVVATEQANFTGQFPESVVQLFAANTQPEQQTLRNEVMRPNPPGTIGGVDQESTFTGTSDDGSTFPSHLYQRKFLTPGRSLIALTVGGPEANSAECQYSAIIRSFSVTGREVVPATPGPSSSGPSSSATATEIIG
jgi:hypothetical protein